MTTSATRSSPADDRYLVPRGWSAVLGVVSLAELVVASYVVIACVEVLADAPGARRAFAFPGGPYRLGTDALFLILAMAAGVVGSFVSAATSYVKYIGNHRFLSRWIPWYVVRAPIGAALAVILYLVFRGGLVPSGGATEAVSPFGVAALSGLAGMFSNRAVDRLEEIFNAAFGKQADADDLPPANRPAVSSVGWVGDGEVLQVTGTDFAGDILVIVGDRVVEPQSTSLTRLTVARDRIEPALQSPPAGGLKLKVVSTSGPSDSFAVPDAP